MHAVRIYQKPGAVISFEVSQYGVPQTLGELIRKHRLERDLYASDLAERIGVTEATILHWEHDTSAPYRQYLVRLQRELELQPADLTKYIHTIAPKLQVMVDYIIAHGEATRAQIQEVTGIRKQQVAYTDLMYLCELGILDRRFGARKRATYFLGNSSE